ncbi:MAG TPA: dephospho-CoA kinase [Acidiferrobacterales bacterium]|nr:dephospho-CoA kinase [Acidiferrobacterales bacterium]
MLRIGLTGGIGSGKSTIAALFAAHGVPVIDADVIAHQLTLPGTSATARILRAFGPDIADTNGGIDRQRLARRIFKDRNERARLEGILHPLIRAEIQRRQENLDAPYCLLVIPLLFEAGQRDMVDRVLVADVDESAQIARVAARDGRSEAEIRAIVASQIDRQQRLKMADDCINNTGDLAGVRAQVEALHRKYLALARDASSGH